MRLFSLCKFVRFETMIWLRIRFDISFQNFKKPLDIFSPQIERKRSKKYLVIILAVQESFEPFSRLELIFEKSKYREVGSKHKLKLKARRLRIFRDTLIPVFVNEKCCFCIRFTELHFFYWLLVVSLVTPSKLKSGFPIWENSEEYWYLMLKKFCFWKVFSN